MFSFVHLLAGQQETNKERSLSLLRGTWEYPTYDEVHTLRFLSDRDVVIDRQPEQYILEQNTLLITNDEGNTAYPFEIKGKHLFLGYPDGTKGEFIRKNFGEAEKRLAGDFYPSGNESLAATCLQFFDDMTFNLTESKGESVETMTKKSGLFRVEDNTIHLIFDDGNREEALIRYHTSDGLADGLVFREELFDREILFNEAPSHDTTIVIIDHPPGPYPTPEFPPIHTPVTQPVLVSQPPENKPRDFGTMRDPSQSKDAGQPNEPHRPRGGRP